MVRLGEGMVASDISGNGTMFLSCVGAKMQKIDYQWLKKRLKTVFGGVNRLQSVRHLRATRAAGVGRK